MGRLSNLLPWKRRRLDHDLDRELQHHIDIRVDELTRTGVARNDARRRALIELGGVAQVQEDVRDTWSAEWLSQVPQDVKFAIRGLGRSPSFALAAVATLGLAIGATTAMFSVINGVLLRPLPYQAPAELVTAWQDMRARGGPAREWATPGNFVDWRAESRVFASMASIRIWTPPLVGMGEAQLLSGEQVTQSYFDVVGVQPAMGRGFRLDEAVPNAPRVVIISHRFWMDRFGGASDVLQKTLSLGGEPHEVVGVMPQGFRPVVNQNADVWRPDRLNLATPSRGAVVLRLIGRLQPTLTVADAQSRMNELAIELGRQHPEFNAKVGVTIVPLHEQVVGNVRPGMLLLLGAVGLVLLIACVNIANLLLVRASSRVREMAVRVALGAARGRVVRQLLTESVVLAVPGGLAGIGISLAALKAFVAFAPAGTPRLDEVVLNSTALAVSAATTILTGVLFGLVPAIQLARANHSPALKEGGRSGAGVVGRRLRGALVVAELAIALMLLVGGGLLLRSFAGMQRADLGFQPDGVVTALIQIPGNRFQSPEDAIAFEDRVMERVAVLPQVTRAAWTSVLPLTADDNDMDFAIEGVPPPPADQQGHVAWYRVVSADYLIVMGMRLRSGRWFEGREAQPSVAISQTLATRYWPGENPVGRRVRFGAPEDGAPWFTIVGVVDDVSQQGARSAARGQIFIPYWHAGPNAAGPMNIVVSTTAAVEPMRQALTQAIREIDPRLPVTGVAPMSSLVARSVDEPLFLASITTVFAMLAMVLAAVGVYGVVASTVAAREQEISVRLALGATRANVIGLLYRGGLKLMAIGVALGAVGAALLAPSLQTLLYGLEPLDPATFVTMGALLMLASSLAVLIPTARAARVSPGAILRN